MSDKAEYDKQTKMEFFRTKILVIVGQTATGKSDLAVKLAEKFNGEIISADSRQIYKGLNIGTGKITLNEMRGIRHHCLDIADPKDRFTVEQWRKCANEAIACLHAENKLPIICGGTGFYISALIDNTEFPPVPPNDELRRKLNSKSTEELQNILKDLDPIRFDNIEKQNPRRLIRAIEIASGSDKRNIREGRMPLQMNYSTLFVGLKIQDDELKMRIRNRLISRIDAGMVEEAKRLHDVGLSYERMDELGLEYRYLAQFIQGKLDKKQFVETLSTKIWQYARRQKTWWKRDSGVHWFAPDELLRIESFVADFLAK
ncbi:tRNA (adenosine(37)-N6)-dimethylallyltransferase MiaA [Patescibacteria group bacterium]|nr:tRNA (adenosine(37)-N6)-dimethylallyltransferase MiaA [Patescibacteria group bacterium]MDE1946545.1 tRNA (adenosine(37)-N6)-dimethylallyltransferase MiaA [Patescibacteria group bacterium]MDE2010894.1 tRNA (adenosine(37)-N6)-dimethylallyltransferase MiaA [Patescibacteria group bacterium]MDE2232778.1 tRNA (adenosine(37)-N6)-dimethylallyltransferase MiaA [Patescibacteria group bacterium]